MSKQSRKIMEKKQLENQGNGMRSMISGVESTLASKVDLRQNTPHADNRVIGDFLSIPTTSPKQYFKPTHERKPSEKITFAYEKEVNQFISPEANAEQNYEMRRRASKSRNKERIEKLMQKTGKTAVTASDSKQLHTLKTSHSGMNSLGFNKSNKEMFSDENLEEDISENYRLGETDTIEKVINGDYEDDQNVNYYSIGNRSFGINEPTHEEYRTPEISEPLIDPFYHKTDDDLLYNQEEFETARLNVENEINKDRDLVKIRDYGDSNQDTSNFKSSYNEVPEEGSFEDSDQMRQFLSSIKKGSRYAKRIHDSSKDSSSADKSGKLLEDEDQREEIDYTEGGDNPTLEMIQEETEINTTKQKESDLPSPSPMKYGSERSLKPKVTAIENDKDNLYHDHKEELFQKRKSELMQKVLNSAYSSKTSFKGNLIDSLELSKSKILF